MFPTFLGAISYRDFSFALQTSSSNVKTLSCSRHLVDVASLRGRPESSENIFLKKTTQKREQEKKVFRMQGA
jgi:hypothetical protein